MPNRRQVLQTGAALSAIALNGALARVAGAVGLNPRAAVRRVIYDDRYAEGRTFAALAAAEGIATRALDAGDITCLYFELAEVLRSERLLPMARRNYVTKIRSMGESLRADVRALRSANRWPCVASARRPVLANRGSPGWSSAP